MECVVGMADLKTFGKAVQCLGKFGDELHIEAFSNKLSMRTVNAAKSAYACFQLHADFFEHFKAEAETRSALPLLRCKLMTKSCLPLFRPIIIGDKFVERVGLKLSTATSHLEVKLYCKFGITKTYNLMLQDCNDLQAIDYKDECPHCIRSQAQILNECVVNFPGNLDEVTMNFTDSALRLKSHFDETNVANSKYLMTEFTVQRSEFDDYRMAGETAVTFCLKELKAILAFCESRRQVLSIYFDKSGKPATFTVADGSAYEADFVMATLAEPIPSNPNSQASQEQTTTQPAPQQQNARTNQQKNANATPAATPRGNNMRGAGVTPGVTPSGRIDTPQTAQGRRGEVPFAAPTPSPAASTFRGTTPAPSAPPASSTFAKPSPVVSSARSDVSRINNTFQQKQTPTPNPTARPTPKPASAPGTLPPLHGPTLPPQRSQRVSASGVPPTASPSPCEDSGKRAHSPDNSDAEEQGATVRSPPQKTALSGRRPLFRITARGRQPPSDPVDVHTLVEGTDDEDSEPGSPLY